MPEREPQPDRSPLAANHQRLIDDSAITPEVAAARGYRTVNVKAELGRLGFADYQRSVPTLLIPVYNARGELATYQSRPDAPRVKKGKSIKYETPSGSPMVVDVPPGTLSRMRDPSVPLVVTEGVRKADAAVSAGLCCVDLLGVWNWRGRNSEGGLTALADWEDIALNGRRVYIVFDSDVMQKKAVHLALSRLRTFLESRDAKVWLIYLPAGDAGAKVGLDDFLAQGNSTDDLLALAVRELRPPPRNEKPLAGDLDRPQILVAGRYMREVSDEAVHALLVVQSAEPRLFRRGNVLVRLRREDQSTIFAAPLDVPALRGMLDRAADFIRLDNDGEALAARPPLDVVQDILALPEPPFPVLRAISAIPLLLATGELVSAQGYHHVSGIFFNLAGLDSLSLMPLDDAKRLILDELLGEFPFTDDASRAHAVALILQPFVRLLFPGPTPLYLIDAPARGTGKGLLADIIARITLGASAPVIAPTHDGDELEKRITSLLLGGSSFILLDNVTGLRAPALAAALTAEVWEARLLGQSQMLRLRNEANWVATGNNVELSDELTRRVIPIRLDAAVAAPEERRDFRHADLARWVREHRGQLVAACVSLVQHWLDAGMPQGNATLGRFEGWAPVIGGILESIGLTGFLANRAGLRSSADHETQEWVGFCDAWDEAFGDTPVTAGRLFGLLRERDLLLDLWAGRSKLSGQQRLGHALAQRRDRVFGGYVIREAGRDSATHSIVYQLRAAAHPTPETTETPEFKADEPDSGGGVSGVSVVLGPSKNSSLTANADTNARTRYCVEPGCIQIIPASSERCSRHLTDEVQE